MKLTENYDLSSYVPGHNARLLRYQGEADECWEYWFDGVLHCSGAEPFRDFALRERKSPEAG